MDFEYSWSTIEGAMQNQRFGDFLQSWHFLGLHLDGQIMVGTSDTFWWSKYATILKVDP